MIDLLTGVDARLARNAAYILDGHDDRHQLVVPAIVVTEVAGTGDIRGDHLAKEVRAERVAGALKWIAASNFIVAELSERLARTAARIAIDHQLKGPDASVLATAVEWKCETLFTRDHGILKCDGQFDGLAVVEPFDQRPGQGDLFDNTYAEGAPQVF